MVDRDRAREMLNGLDEAQQKVATCLGGPVVVLAGAGTGKTKAITHRIAYGTWSGVSDPRRTLAVTFTAKAAQELRERLVTLGIPQVQARTFHAAALRQLRYFWPRVYGRQLPEVTSATFALIAKALRPLQIAVDTALLRDLAAEISWAKVSNVTPEAYPQLAEQGGRVIANLSSEQVAGVMERYEYVKRRNECLDFDDILLCAVALLHEHPEIATQIRDQYRHLTVDEYQDVSPVQQSLLDLWLGDGQDICVVGDQNQAIHGFAGADPDFLLNFAARHQATCLKLTTNYRSTPQVIALANTLLPAAHRLRANRAAGPRVTISPSDNEASEPVAVAAWLRARHDEGVGWDDLAVLYRINAQSEELAKALADASIPHWVKENRPEAVSLERTDQGRGVTLTTMHASKGLEWEGVAIIGLSEGLMPFAMADSSGQIAEEKRLLYVAMTRARTFLRLSWAVAGINGRQRRPSRFLVANGLIADSHGPAKPARTKRDRRTKIANCRVCGQVLLEAAEIKYGHHADCEVEWDADLYNALVKWRLELARERSMPAFVIFTDATLRAIAEYKPANIAELLLIRGVGRTKANDFGERVLKIVAEHR